MYDDATSIQVAGVSGKEIIVRRKRFTISTSEALNIRLFYADHLCCHRPYLQKVFLLPAAEYDDPEMESPAWTFPCSMFEINLQN